MNNQEKAREICRGYNYHGRLTPQGVAGFAVDRCKEMADWKDQQFKEYLEKKKDSLEMDYHKDSYEGNAYKHSVLMEIINELFGGE